MADSIGSDIYESRKDRGKVGPGIPDPRELG
jgi:hypothetical protein